MKAILMALAFLMAAQAQAKTYTCKTNDGTRSFTLKSERRKNTFTMDVTVLPSAQAKSNKAIELKDITVIASRETTKGMTSVIISPEVDGRPATWDETDLMLEMHHTTPDLAAGLSFAPHSALANQYIKLGGDNSGYLYCDFRSLSDLAER